MKQQSQLWLLTGEQGLGKSLTLQLLISQLQDELPEISIEGLLSPGVFRGSDKIAIDLLDIKSGERRQLARRHRLSEEGLTTKHWVFNQDTFEWGNRRLQQIPPVQFLIIDEIGPLELKQGACLQAALQCLDSPNFKLGLVVIRPSLIAIAEERWQPQIIFNIEEYGGVEPLISDLITRIEIHFLEKGPATMNKDHTQEYQIAFVSDDGQTISAHFGRARQYAVITLSQGEIVNRELRSKFTPHVGGQREQHGDHDRGHSHNRMVEPILDCQLVVARGMGFGAQSHLDNAGIEVLMTDQVSIDEAVQAYLEGTLTHQPNRLHAGHSHHHDHADEDPSSGPSHG